MLGFFMVVEGQLSRNYFFLIWAPFLHYKILGFSKKDSEGYSLTANERSIEIA